MFLGRFSETFEEISFREDPSIVTLFEFKDTIVPPWLDASSYTPLQIKTKIIKIFKTIMKLFKNKSKISQIDCLPIDGFEL